MTAILECSNCGFQAVFEQEDGLNECPKCTDIHVDVTYGVSSYVSYRGVKTESDAEENLSKEHWATQQDQDDEWINSQDQEYPHK